MTNQPSPDLSIIIVNWKSADYLRKCLESINSGKTKIDHEIIVVDNASYDGCGEMLNTQFPSVIFIQSPENLGFSRANNLGFQNSSGKRLLFLNPDTELIGNALDEFHEVFEKLDSPGIVGCRLLNSDGSLQTSCVQSFPTVMNQVLDSEFLRNLFPRSHLWGVSAYYKDGQIHVVEGISGACMLVDRNVFEQVGGFSTDYFMYGEDLDLCQKTRFIGKYNYYISNICVLHHGGGSTKSTPNLIPIIRMRESVGIFLRKFNGNISSFAYRILTGILAIARMGFLLILFPYWTRKKDHQSWVFSFRKWQAIFCWGFGFPTQTS